MRSLVNIIVACFPILYYNIYERGYYMYLFEKKDEELEKVADKLCFDENNMLLSDEDYHGYIIPLTELNKMMNHLNTIYSSEFQKQQNPLSRRPKINFFGTLSFYKNTSQALKDVLDFLKEIDNDLYLYALRLFVGQEKDTINIYDLYSKEAQEQIKFGKLSHRSSNVGNECERKIFVVLDESLDSNIAEKIRNFIGSNKCTLRESITLMHEISHCFDRNYNKITVNPEHITDPRFVAKYPPVVSFYLSETTAIFFETIFAEHLAEKDPALQSSVDNLILSRICMNQLSVKRARALSALVRIKEEKGYVPEGFLSHITQKGVSETLRKDIISSHPLYQIRKYALSQFFVPTMVKKYNEDKSLGKERIKKYLECCCNDDFDGALKAFDMDIQDKDTYNSMLDNYRDFIVKYREKNKPEPDIEL